MHLSQTNSFPAAATQRERPCRSPLHDILHREYAGASFMLTGSTAARTRAPCAGFVRSHGPFPHQEPHENRLWAWAPTFCIDKGCEGTLGTRTPNNLLSITHTGPTAQSASPTLLRLYLILSFLCSMRILTAQDVISGNVPNSIAALRSLTFALTSLP